MWELILQKAKEQGFVVILLLGISWYLWQDNRELRGEFIEYLKTENDKIARDSLVYDIIKE